MNVATCCVQMFKHTDLLTISIQPWQMRWHHKQTDVVMLAFIRQCDYWASISNGSHPIVYTLCQTFICWWNILANTGDHRDRSLPVWTCLRKHLFCFSVCVFFTNEAWHYSSVWRVYLWADCATINSSAQLNKNKKTLHSNNLYSCWMFLIEFPFAHLKHIALERS